MQTPLVPFKSVLSKEVSPLRRPASRIFPVRVAMRTRAVERYEGAFKSSNLLYVGKKG